VVTQNRNELGKLSPELCDPGLRFLIHAIKPLKQRYVSLRLGLAKSKN